MLNGADMVKLKWCLSAHADAVTTVQVCRVPSNPSFLLSSGYDCVVEAWSTSAQFLGTLCRSVHRGRNPDWNVPVDVSGRMRQEASEARETLAQLRRSSSWSTPLTDVLDEGFVPVSHPVLGREGRGSVPDRWNAAGGGMASEPVHGAASAAGAAGAAAQLAERAPPSPFRRPETNSRVAVALGALDELNIRKPPKPSRTAAKRSQRLSAPPRGASGSSTAGRRATGRVAFDSVGRQAMGVPPTPSTPGAPVRVICVCV